MTNDVVFRPVDSLQMMAYIIKRCRALHIDINATKLQKLMYCCYGVTLARLDCRLCDESPEAWQFGPVFPRTLITMKNNGLTGFESIVPAVDSSLIPTEISSVIDRTLEFFGKYSASQLSMWSHLDGSPWSICSNKGKCLYGQIDDSTIRTYFNEHVIVHKEVAPVS